jgi:hypothetical protein
MKPDQVPQPKDPEIIVAERICQEIREIAKKLPKPEHTENEQKHTQFGNNFYYLFLTNMEKENLDSSFVEIYAGKARKKYGQIWEKFLKDNSDLTNKINEVLKQQEIMSQLMERYVRLLRNQKTWELSDQISEEINLKGIGSYIWNRLNPLLKQASEIMARCGIKPEDFYG